VLGWLRSTPARPAPGQESVWDYPRPPRLERCAAELRVVFDGEVVAETVRGWRVLETSHPPTYYIPPADVRTELLRPGTAGSVCEFKGAARYWTLRVRSRVAIDVAWSYPAPTPAFAPIRDHLSFYAGRVDACFVDGEQVMAQDGDFYGGWVTTRIVGPFKGAPGTGGW